jgi:hypothetical protein
MRARLAVGRRDDDAFYVGAYFSDPEQPQAWDLYLKDLSISDAKLRRSRAESAPRESVGD